MTTMTPDEVGILRGRDVQKLQVEMSKWRTEYNAAESAERQTELMQMHPDLEKRFQEAVEAQLGMMDKYPDIGPLADEDRQAREFDELYHKASLTRMLIAADTNKALEGVDLEVRQMFLPDGGRRENTIPLAMFLDDHESYEIRQDTATTVNAATGRKETFPIAQRVFGESAGAYMGARYISVPGGQQDFPFISSGVSGIAKDENEEIDATQGVISVRSSNPKEVGVAYLWGLTTQLRFSPGELESALRADARAAIGDYMDGTIIQGQEADAANDIPAIPGLNTMAYSAGSTSAPTADATALSMLEFGARHVDGRWAATDDNVRYLVPPLMWQRAAYLLLQPNSDLLLKRMLAGRFRASYHIPDGAASAGKRDSDFITYAPDGDMGELIVPMWQDVLVTFDQVQHANRRQRRLSLDTAYDVIIRRNNPWRRNRAQFDE